MIFSWNLCFVSIILVVFSQVAPHLEQAADNAADVITTSAAVIAEHAQPVAEDVASQVSQCRE